jgi:gamma-glutamylcyclotransferase (GGCT)/AIG2-like uncharacterized protein YtfP
MMFVNLFVYGTLLSPETRETVFGRPVPYMDPDTISGFEIDVMSIADFSYPALVRNKTSMVHGGIVLIHENELRLLGQLTHGPRIHGLAMPRLSPRTDMRSGG